MILVTMPELAVRNVTEIVVRHLGMPRPKRCFADGLRNQQKQLFCGPGNCRNHHDAQGHTTGQQRKMFLHHNYQA